jgi:putative flippase GtrA
MNYLSRLVKKYSEFIKFCFVGLTNTVVSFLVYFILLKFDLNYLFSSTVGYVAGILNGYILSSKYVFKKSQDIKSVIKFFIVYGSSLLLNLFLLYIMVEKFSISKLIAQFVAIIINTIYNYLFNKLWTFKR